MKKVYLVETNADFACHIYNGYDFEYYLNNTYWRIFPTLKEAKQYLVSTTKTIKERFGEQINIEKKRKNTITVDLVRYNIDDNKDFFEDKTVYLEDLWCYEHQLVDSRYLCGRY